MDFFFKINMEYNSKKGISAVIATILLLLLVVVALVGFQIWYQSFQSGFIVSVEGQDRSSFDYGIDTIVGNVLYIKTGDSNLTISKVQIDGIDCQINGTIQNMEALNISSCIENITTSTPEIVVVTENNIISKRVYLRDVSNLNIASLSPSSLCDSIGNGEWSEVEGNPTYGTDNFCVMRWTAKAYNSSSTSFIADGGMDGGFPNNWADLDEIEAYSAPNGLPWVKITWQQAKVACENLGTGFALITEEQWLTIANDVVNQDENWNSSTVGTGAVFRGNVNLADTISCSNGGVMDGFTEADCIISGGDFDGRNKRMLYLSSGDTIFDFSGNAWQFVDEEMHRTSRYHGGNQQWMNYHGDATNVPALKRPPSGWNQNQGMGRYFDGNSLSGGWNTINEAPDFCLSPPYCSTDVVFLRGGAWNRGVDAGVFTLGLDAGKSASLTGHTFRCTFTP